MTVAHEHRYPKTITVDNGSEFISLEMGGCAYRNGVALDFIRPDRRSKTASSRASTVASATSA
jgi:transposase InsO family protein